MNDRRKRKLNLLAASPYCYWCKQRVYDILPGRGERGPDNMATLEHIYSRLHPHRRSRKRGKCVLACAKCNNERGIAESKPHLLGTWRPRESGNS